MSCFRNKILVRRRVRRGEPVLHLLLQLVAYRIPSVTAANCGVINKRWVLFILFNVWWSVTTTSCQRRGRLFCARHIPKSRRMLSVDALPSNETCAQNNIQEQSYNNYTPSMRTLTLPTSPWTTPMVCATVIRASSCVNRSNLPEAPSLPRFPPASSS